MIFLLTKLFLTSGIIVVITEIAKRSDKFGGLVAALPLTTILIITWMYYEGASSEKLSKHMGYTLFFLLPTLPMFVVFPYFIGKFGFYVALMISLVLTVACLIAFNAVATQVGFKIL
tara:strand:- start:181 stop:531 length:351 start_codon:yes stop_codon:yes gene_type:complete